MIDQHTIELVTHAPLTERLQLIEVILQSLKHDISPITVENNKNTAKSDQLLGLFADEIELIDQITESAMQARERDPLRVA